MYDDDLPCGYFDAPSTNPPTPQPQPTPDKQQCCESPSPCSCTQAPKPLPTGLKLCFKCKTTPGSLLYKSEPMCKGCALKNVEYKCRVSLQNKIKIANTDRLLVGLSGGVNSVCLVNILKEIEGRYQKHHLFAGFEVVHVDLGVIAQPGYGQMAREKLERFAKERDFKLVIIKLEEIYEKQPERVKTLMSGFKEGADHGDLIDVMIDRLLQQYARKNNLILTKATSGQRVAANIFKYIVKGNGGNIGDLSFRHSNTILPLRDHLTRQIQFYFHCKSLDQYLFPPPISQSHKLSDILQDFIDTLQDTYSHTCPTILRTSEKIKVVTEGFECQWCRQVGMEKDLCLRCQRILEHWGGEGDVRGYLPECFM